MPTKALDIAQLETDLETAQETLSHVREQLNNVSFERDSLRAELDAQRQRADELLVRAAAMEAIMHQVSAGLVAGLSKMQGLQERQRADRKLQQERKLGVGSRDTPSFLGKPEPGQAGTAMASAIETHEERPGDFVPDDFAEAQAQEEGQQDDGQSDSSYRTPVPSLEMGS